MEETRGRSCRRKAADCPRAKSSERDHNRRKHRIRHQSVQYRRRNSQEQRYGREHDKVRSWLKSGGYGSGSGGPDGYLDYGSGGYRDGGGCAERGGLTRGRIFDQYSWRAEEQLHGRIAASGDEQDIDWGPPADWGPPDYEKWDTDASKSSLKGEDMQRLQHKQQNVKVAAAWARGKKQQRIARRKSDVLDVRSLRMGSPSLWDLSSLPQLRHLEMNNCSFADISCLSALQQLTHLAAAGNYLSKGSIQVIGHYLLQLQHLSIDLGEYPSELSVYAACSSLSTLTGLTALCIGANAGTMRYKYVFALGADQHSLQLATVFPPDYALPKHKANTGHDSSVEWLQFLTALTNLQQLSLHAGRYGADCRVLAAALSASLSSAKQLQQLTLESWRFLDAAGLAGVAAFSSKLAELDLTHRPELVSPKSLHQLQHLTCMTRLVLSHNRLGHESSSRAGKTYCSANLRSRAAALAALKRLPQLLHLELDDCAVLDGSALGSLSLLTYLSAAGNYFHSRTIQSLGKLDRLYHLDLQYALAAGVSTAEVSATVSTLSCLGYLRFSPHNSRGSNSSFSRTKRFSEQLTQDSYEEEEEEEPGKVPSIATLPAAQPQFGPYVLWHFQSSTLWVGGAGSNEAPAEQQDPLQSLICVDGPKKGLTAALKGAGPQGRMMQQLGQLKDREKEETGHGYGHGMASRPEGLEQQLPGDGDVSNAEQQQGKQEVHSAPAAAGSAAVACGAAVTHGDSCCCAENGSSSSSTLATEMLMGFSRCVALKELHMSIDAGLCLQHMLTLRDTLASLTQLTSLRLQSSEYFPGALLLGLAAFGGRVQHLDLRSIRDMVTAASLQQLVVSGGIGSNTVSSAGVSGSCFSCLTHLVMDGAWLGSSAAEAVAASTKQPGDHRAGGGDSDDDGAGTSDVSSDAYRYEWDRRSWGGASDSEDEDGDLAELALDWPPGNESLARCRHGRISREDDKRYGIKLSSSHQHVCHSRSATSMHIPAFSCRCDSGSFRSGKFKTAGLQGLVQAAPLLRHLQMDRCHAHNITALTALQGLTYLSATGNAFTDRQAVAVLKQLRQLQHVDFRGSLWSRGYAGELWAIVLQLGALTYLDLSIYGLYDCTSSSKVERVDPAATAAAAGQMTISGVTAAAAAVGIDEMLVDEAEQHTGGNMPPAAAAAGGRGISASAAASAPPAFTAGPEGLASVPGAQALAWQVTMSEVPATPAAAEEVEDGEMLVDRVDQPLGSSMPAAAAFAPLPFTAGDGRPLDRQSQLSSQHAKSPLQVLIVEGCNLDDDALAHITSCCPQLQTLCVGWNYITSNGLARPLSAVCGSLLQLSLRCMDPQLDAGAAAIAAMSVPGLTAVDLAGNACGDGGAMVLCNQGCWPKLQYLDLAGNGLSAAAARQVVEARGKDAASVECSVVLDVPYGCGGYSLYFNEAVSVFSGRDRGFLKARSDVSVVATGTAGERVSAGGVVGQVGTRAADGSGAGCPVAAGAQGVGAAAKYGSWCLVPAGKESRKCLLPNWVDDRSGYDSY